VSREFSIRAWVLPLVSVLIVVALLGAATLLGVRGRRDVAGQKSFNVGSAPEAYAVLKEAGVRGRVVVLLDSQSDIVARIYDRAFMSSVADSSSSAPFQPLNLAGGLIETGIARAVYVVPAPSARDEIVKRLGSRWDSRTLGDRIELRFNGAPVHVVLGDFDPATLGERVVVYAKRSALADYDPSMLAKLESSAVSIIVVQDTP